MAAPPPKLQHLDLGLLKKQNKTSYFDELSLKQSRTWMRATTWCLVGATAFSLAWLALAQTDEVVIARGKLEPIGSVKDIQMPLGGVAAEILVKDGDQVKAGQPLMRMDTEASRQKQQALVQTIRLTENQLALKNVEIQRFLEMNSQQVTQLAESLSLQEVILNRLGILAKQGASSELQYLQQSNKTKEARGQLMQAKIDRFRQLAIMEQSLKQLRAELSSLQGQLSEIDVTIRYQTLRSPVDGIIFDLKPKSPGYSAQTTESVMKVVPFNKLQAAVQIPSSKIGLVQVGVPAEVSIDSFPASDFGTLEGTVKWIGSDALAPERNRQAENTGFSGEEYRYPATVQLASQKLKLKSGQQLPLQVGMSLNANIKLRKVSYLQLLLGSFRDKAESLKRI
ncbi:HlyD family efflux transporter periplasmic adaptor subunit [Synechococcus sp. J7-Johnson]|uniref:HlyD family secretion protein n=1 Tax=Synechococcus sp. J7-Johnson TaxID=2823737 RepID=UPI0020CCFCA7|nr:HlyD family efflux transporter periplasmic adaptor subunit [Synechococcus sp. J7-Johnson]MCP9840541.1 HlyD family efflux transporter periplasmic adaptor subunit [Synechococcus sp. J7-Johnson]